MKGSDLKNFFLASVCLIGLASCGTVSTGGAGQTSTGDPVAGEFKLDQATQVFELSLISPGRWTCSGSFQRSGQNLSTRTIPVNCSNGLKGTATLTANQFQGQIVGSFRLSSGEAGQVVFGNT